MNREYDERPTDVTGIDDWNGFIEYFSSQDYLENSEPSDKDRVMGMLAAALKTLKNDSETWTQEQHDCIDKALKEYERLKASDETAESKV